MVGMRLVFSRHHLLQFHLDLEWRLAGGHSGAVANAKNMGVNGDGRFTKSNIEHDVAGLATDARQGLQRFARARHLSAMLGEKFSRQCNHVFRFGPVKTNGLYKISNALFTQGDHFCGVISERKQGWRRLVDAGIGGLRREHDRYQQCKRIDVLELSLGFGIGSLEPTECLFDPRRCPLRQLAGSGLEIGGDLLWLRLHFCALPQT